MIGFTGISGSLNIKINAFKNKRNIAYYKTDIYEIVRFYKVKSSVIIIIHTVVGNKQWLENYLYKHIDHSTADNTTHARNKTTDQTYDLIYDNTEALLF